MDEAVTKTIFPVHRQRLLEILNSGQYQAPIIVFVNQKKTADMVAKDLSRAGVRWRPPPILLWHLLTVYFSGAPRLCIRAKIRSNERHRYRHSALVHPTFWLQRTS